MEHLDAVVVSIGHGHDPAGAEGGDARHVKLAGATSLSIPAGAIPPYLIGERAVGVEHLDAIAERIGRGHDPARAEGAAGWFVKVTKATSPSMQFGAISP